jgi:hypothetical protein
MCPQVVKFMEHSKTERLYEDRRKSLSVLFNILQEAFWEFRRSHVAMGDLCPRLIDVCLEPEVRNLLDVVTPMEDLHEQLLTFFPQICARWRESVESRLLEWMSTSIGFPKEGSTFQLASAIFKCSTCGDALWYPAVLAHGCLNAVVPPGTFSLSHNYDQVAIMVFCRHPFSVGILDLNTWSETITKVLHLWGFDPKTATCEQLDQANGRLTCKPCNESGRRRIMTWSTLVSFEAFFPY